MVAVPSKGRADAGFHRVAPEAAATRDLYERHAAKIFAFCLSRLRDREEAEDATQSTFLNAFRGLQRGIEPEHEQAWLYKIAENVCLTRQRSRVRRRRVESPGDLDALQDVIPSPEHEADELLGLPEALQAMPEQQRRALLLREWQGLSYREIADELELSQAAVETLLFRARRSLASGLVDEPQKKGLVARVRAAGDTGSIAALLKTLLLSGGAKVVVAGVVAAGSLVAGSAGVRHTLEDVVVPQHKGAAVPVVPVAPAVPSYTAVSVPVHHVVAEPKAAPVAAVRHARRPAHVRHAPPVLPAASVRHEHPQHPAHPVVPAALPAVHQPRRVDAVPQHTQRTQAAPPAGSHRHATGRGHVTQTAASQQRQQHQQQQSSPQAQQHGAAHQQPTAPEQPTPVGPVTAAATAVQQQAGNAAQGVANALGHAKK